jgi:signal transduction histidine kinase
MSHELLTPVSKVLNGVDLLTRLAGQHHLPQFDQSIEIIRSGAEELRWLLEDLLLINQLDDGRVGPFRQPIDLTDAVRVIVAQTEAKYRRKNLVFTIDIPERWSVHIHRKHLYHVLHHLLDNAAKFSPDGGRLSLAVQPVDGAGATVEIHNQGQTIEPELLEKIFDKFYQVDMTMTRESGGLGLGLYIARALARTYGGDVTLISLPGLGVTTRWLIPDTPADWS